VVVQVDVKSRPTPEHDHLLPIGELARLSGRPASSIRYYEQIGLLPEPIRVGGQRRYPDHYVRMLAVIDTAQRVGLSLDEIKILLAAAGGGGKGANEELRSAASRKLTQVTAEIERAILIQKWLEKASRCECPDLDECALLANPVIPHA
jgi:MerR family transcriptional regulator, redox-sensitive transcriptional activator SoxR